MQRRSFIKNSLLASAVTALAGKALASSNPALAESPDKTAEAFKASNLEDALTVLDVSPEASDKIELRTPEIAENGAVVPITVSTSIKDASQITLLVSNNPMPMAAQFHFSHNPGEISASTRLKMGETSDVLALVTAGNKTYMAKQEIKVTIGGCGG